VAAGLEQTARARGFGVEIFLVSLAAIVLEIGYTRIFSFKLYYYFTYLILGIALLGLGSGGIGVALSQRLRGLAPERTVAAACLAAGLAVPASYLVVALVQVNTVDLTAKPGEIAGLALVCLALFLPFLLVGIALATILGARPERVSRLYGVDLVGAAVGCGLCVPLFVFLGPPRAVVLAGLVLTLAGARLSAAAWRRGLALALPLAAGLAAALLLPDALPDPVPDRIKSMSPQHRGDSPTLFTSWSALFRVDVLEGMRPEKNYLIMHDGIMGSIVHRFDGDWSSLSDFDSDTRALPFAVLPRGPRVLVIGAAGGHEILASLYFGASEVVAVELNPVTVSLLTDHFADYAGHIAEDERVRLVNAEGRSFLERDAGRYDLIWFVAPDSYSAMNAASSGAFVLSESYLYTVEMVDLALARLSQEGVVCVQFGEVFFDQKPNRTTRYLATAREAMRRRGVERFRDHVLMSVAPGIFTHATVLLGASPFAADAVRSFRETNGAIAGSRILHAGRDGARGDRHPVQEVISLPRGALAGWLERYPYDVRPVIDDSPFFWHFVPFRDAVLRPWGQTTDIWDPEDATGERMLLLLLLVAVVFASVFLLLPLLAVRDIWGRIPHKRHAAVYFAALGLGFMFYEVCLIQKLTRFLGFPTYSLTVTLFSLLSFSGVGSLLSARYAFARRRALGWLLAGVLLLTPFYQFGLAPLTTALADAPLPARAALAALLVAPLGLCLGAFMPLGLGAVAALSRHPREYVAWAWAVNGFFSVVSSVLATILSMSLGFRAVLLLAACIYAVGVLALRRIPEPPAGPAYSR
jgi:hypothetical protein